MFNKVVNKKNTIKKHVKRTVIIAGVVTGISVTVILLKKDRESTAKYLASIKIRDDMSKVWVTLNDSYNLLEDAHKDLTDKYLSLAESYLNLTEKMLDQVENTAATRLVTANKTLGDIAA